MFYLKIDHFFIRSFVFQMSMCNNDLTDRPLAILFSESFVYRRHTNCLHTYAYPFCIFYNYYLVESPVYLTLESFILLLIWLDFKFYFRHSIVYLVCTDAISLWLETLYYFYILFHILKLNVLENDSVLAFFFFCKYKYCSMCHSIIIIIIII